MTAARDRRSGPGMDDLARQPAPSVLVVMGVSGSGKTTIGTLLAERLGWEFADGDDFHPPANVEKMHGGHPLTDEDRWPWLHAIAAWIDKTCRAGGHGVVACSALKRASSLSAPRRRARPLPCASIPSRDGQSVKATMSAC